MSDEGPHALGFDPLPVGALIPPAAPHECPKPKLTWKIETGTQWVCPECSQLFTVRALSAAMDDGRGPGTYWSAT